MELFKHQKEILEWAPERIVLVWETGTGKSLAAMELAKKTGERTLIICPKSLKLDWIQKSAYMGDMRHVMTKEEFRKDFDKLPRYNCVIVDEAHYFFGMKSQMSKSLEKYVNKKHNVRYRYFLTATPQGSSPWNIYRMCILYGLKISYIAFDKAFFDSIPMGGRMIPVVKIGIEDRLLRLIKKVSSVVRLDECADVPEQTFITEYFELTDEQKKAIETLDDILPITRYGKIHQICGGSLKGDGYVESKRFKSNKLDRVIELCETNKKVIVVCRYNNEIEMIKESLGDSKPVFVINGEVTGDDRHKIVEDCKTLDQYIVLINAACSEGYQIPTCPLMVFYSYDFQLKSWIQMKGRILRIDKLKKNVYMSLVVKGTIDEAIFETVTVKKNTFHMNIYCDMLSR